MHTAKVLIGASLSEPHTSKQCGIKKLHVSFVCTYVRTYVLVLVLITSKSLPALILRVLVSFVNSKLFINQSARRHESPYLNPLMRPSLLPCKHKCRNALQGSAIALYVQCTPQHPILCNEFSVPKEGRDCGSSVLFSLVFFTWGATLMPLCLVFQGTVPPLLL